MKKLTSKSFISYVKLAKIELIVIALSIFADQLSKILVAHFMALEQNIAIIPKFLNIHYTKNYKAGFSFDFGLGNILGETGLRWFFIIFVTITTSVFAFFMVRGAKNHKLFKISLALIVSGAIGNLIDRIFVGGVRDFIMFEFFGKEIFSYSYFPIFNIADSALVVGVVLFAVYFIFYYSKDEKAKEQAKAQNSDGGNP